MKSNAPKALQQFLADCAPFGKIKRLRSDNGTEFMSQHFQSILRENRIRHETSAPYSPHQNGIVERAWLSLFNMAIYRCLLLEAKLQKSMWPYAVMAAAYIRNRCFNVRLGKTPYEALTGSKPNLSNMHIFGCTCYAYTQNAKKLDPRSKKGIFVGYDKGSPAYLVYYPDTTRSMSDYGFQLLKKGPLVSWRCRKQATVALSTCEAEYMALTEAVQEQGRSDRGG